LWCAGAPAASALVTTMKDRILQTIREEGPLPFERFMELALYEPEGGFFAGDVLRSQKAGDFLTSPAVSTLVGEPLARSAAEEEQRRGAPSRLVEGAGGPGSLVRPLPAADPLEAWRVGVAPRGRAALAVIVGEGRVVATVAEVGERWRGVVLGNELMDNLP